MSDSASGISLEQAGYDEQRLHDWLAEDPSRLGLGDMQIEAQELRFGEGGRLDLLVSSRERMYSVEVQLREADTSHGFRVLEYWARNRRRWPEKAHVAVLVCESAEGRYRPALETLAEYLPLVVIHCRAERAGGEASIRCEVVIANGSLDIPTVSLGEMPEERSEETWRELSSPEAWQALGELVSFTREHLPPTIYVDYSLSSKISLRHGRSLWASVRPIKAGISVAIPDPDGLKGTISSQAFEFFADVTARSGVGLAWQPNSNAGAQPVILTLRPEDALDSGVRGLLKASWMIMQPGAEPYTSLRQYSEPRGEAADYPVDVNWRGEFEPYYAGEYSEVNDYSGGTYALVVYADDHDSSDVFFATTELDWDTPHDKREFARRILTHHLKTKPTAKQIEGFVKGPAASWEAGQLWALDVGDLARWLWENG